MATECHPEQLEFHAPGRGEVIGRFDGGRVSSDGGGLLLSEVGKRLGLLDRLAACFTDYSNPSAVEHSAVEHSAVEHSAVEHSAVEHSVQSLVTQRV